MEKISVIMAVYNTKEFLKQSVQSVLNQSHQQLELLLINDNSEPACRQLIEGLASTDNRVKVFHFEERKGVGAARNFGIDKATGNYLYFLDSDDYLPPQTLEILTKNIKNHDFIRGRIKTVNFSSGLAIILDGLFKTRLYIDRKFNLIKNNSALNFLFRKEFVLQYQLAFSEDIERYADLAFMIPAVINVEQIPHVREAIYFKRRRKDPIGNPSLMQFDVEYRINDFLQMYSCLKDSYDDEMANTFLDKKILNFYRKNIVPYFGKTDDIEPYFSPLSEAAQKVNPETLGKYDRVLKKEIHALASGSISKYRKVNTRHHLLRDIRLGFKSKRNLYKLLYKRIFVKAKLQRNVVFFESFQARNYSDSPKYIFEYMRQHRRGFKYVWSINKKQDIPGDPVQIKRFSLRYFYYLGRAKYLVNNARFPGYIQKRDDQVYLQTWHGTPLKQLAGDMDDVYMPGTNSANYKRNFFNETQKWDYLIAPNAYSAKIFKRAFWFDGTMIESGYPRNDILYNKNNNAEIENLKGQLNLPQDKKVILYAPTWRDDEFYGKGKYKFNLQLDLEKMRQQLSDEYIVLLRMHYVIASRMDISGFDGFVYDVSSYNDVGELYLISDILITDYSSVFFDYANLKRPILFYTYDLEKYRDQLRGFYIDIETEVPGPLVKTTHEIIDSIQNIDRIQEDYEERYEAFYERFCKWDDGHASEKAVKEVFNQ